MSSALSGRCGSLFWNSRTCVTVGRLIKEAFGEEEAAVLVEGDDGVVDVTLAHSIVSTGNPGDMMPTKSGASASPAQVGFDGALVLFLLLLLPITCASEKMVAGAASFVECSSDHGHGWRFERGGFVPGALPSWLHAGVALAAACACSDAEESSVAEEAAAFENDDGGRRD